jgi:hypothetical protein
MDFLAIILGAIGAIATAIAKIITTVVSAKQKLAA